jgi:hypothetical protein
MSIFGIDYAWNGPSIETMKAAKVRFACRYLSHTPGKNLTPDEAKRLSANDIDIVVVWETTANRALSGRDGGKVDALNADAQAHACGMPADRPIYFAVDWDAVASQQDEINAYLDGAASVLGRDRVGLYAGFYPIKRAFDAGKIKYGWQTYAWSGGKWDSRAQLQQYRNGVNLGGSDVDYDRAMDADFGQWKVGENMAFTDADVQKLLRSSYNASGDKVGESLQAAKNFAEFGRPKLEDLDKDVAAVKAKVDSLGTGVPATVDIDALATAVAAKLATDLADKVADLLAARLAE